MESNQRNSQALMRVKKKMLMVIHDNLQFNLKFRFFFFQENAFMKTRFKKNTYFYAVELNHVLI